MTEQPAASKSYSKHDKYSCPKPEHLNTNTTYSISLSPSDRQQYYESKDRVCKFKTQWYGRFLIHLSPYASYDLYMEVSKEGRLHFHGTIQIKDILNFYLISIPFMRDNMTYEIDTIKDLAEWLKYCTKQAHLFEGGVSPRVKSLKDQQFSVELSKHSGVIVTKHVKTIDEYFAD